MANGKNATLLWNIVQEIETCMMVTQHKSIVHARPMRGRAIAEENVIWFVTEKASPKATEVQDDANVCLTYADTKRNSYVSLSGPLELIDDHDQLASLWNDKLAGYFDKPSDDRAVLLRFTPKTGEYWDGPGNSLVLAIKFVEAAIIGRRPEVGVNDKITF